jgi:hypothetical protein
VYLAVFLAVAISGCAATGAPFAPDGHSGGDKVTLYVYRPALAVNCCVAPYILINDRKQGQLKNGGYLSFVLDPGPITVEAVNEPAGFKSLKLTLDAKTGESYYLRWSAAAMMGWKPLHAEQSKEVRMKQDDVFFSTDEAKKRAETKAQGGQDSVLRAADTDSTLDNGALAQQTSMFAIEHERELLVIDSSRALKEIVLTKRSE